MKHPPGKVLIVEDDPVIRMVLEDNLALSGYQIEQARDGEEAWVALSRSLPDLVLLDLMLPGIDGLELCRRLRQQGATVPVLMLTAKGGDDDVIEGLAIGADDYVTKPFNIDVVVARVASLLRRGSIRASQHAAFDFGPNRIEFESRKFFQNDLEVELTHKEFGLMEFFVRNLGCAITRDQILNAVWGHDLIVTDRSVDRCITTLRKKIERDPRCPEFITTVRNIGYRFEVR